MPDANEGVVISIVDIYREVVGMRSEVQGLVIQVKDLRDDTRDHETRIRAVESAQSTFVTDADVRAKSNRTAAWCAALSGVVAVIVAAVALMVQ